MAKRRQGRTRPAVPVGYSQPMVEAERKHAVGRRRLGGLLVIAIMAAGLWLWGQMRASNKDDLVRTRIEAICRAIQAEQPDLGRFFGSEAERDRIVPALRDFFAAHAPADEAVETSIERGPAPLTPDVDATHHATLTAANGEILRINAHCSDDATAVELLGYVRPP